MSEPTEEQNDFLEKIKREREETAKAIKEGGFSTEFEMRDANVPFLETLEELMNYISALADRPHDYGTTVYAVSMAATAAFNFMAAKLGITGFQAGAADFDMLRRTRHLEAFTILDYKDLLWPQYAGQNRTITAATHHWLRRKALELLAENANNNNVHPAVRAHWIKIRDGVVPHGFMVEEDAKASSARA